MNPVELIAGRHKELRKAREGIGKVQAELERERHRQTELQAGIGAAELADQTALADALVAGRPEPRPGGGDAARRARAAAAPDAHIAAHPAGGRHCLLATTEDGQHLAFGFEAESDRPGLEIVDPRLWLEAAAEPEDSPLVFEAVQEINADD